MKAFVSSRIPEEWLDRLAEHFEVDYYNWFEDGLLPREELAERIKDCHLIVTETDEIDGEMIAGCPDLFAIVDFKSSVVNLDVDQASRQGVVVFNTPGRNADAVADLAVAFMVMTARNVVQSMQALQAGLWEKNGRRWAYVEHQGRELLGKTVGLVGLGHIGQLVAERLGSWGAELIAYDPYQTEEAAGRVDVSLVGWEEVFRQADFLSLHLPLNEGTRGLIGEKELCWMKPDAHLINTARAAVVVEEDLIRCLEEKWIAGAAVDVYHREPIGADYPLLDLPHVICTPHIGGASRDVVDHMAEIGLEGLFAFLAGETPANLVNPESIPEAREKISGEFKS